MNDTYEAPTVSMRAEYNTEEQTDRLADGLRTANRSLPVYQAISAAYRCLRDQDLLATRLVFTGDMVQSVHDREDRGDRPFTMERGAGVVAAKTMPPGPDGIVDILVPTYLLGSSANDDDADEALYWLRHVVAHEATHATLFHIGGEPFDAHKRAESGAATMQFVLLASELVEEHLAEYLAAENLYPGSVSTADSLRATFDAFEHTLVVDLPGVPEGDPDYFAEGMRITFEALHIVWKTLAYLAAEVRSRHGFSAVEADIAQSEPWRKWVAPWWDEFLRLLSYIPMVTDVNVAATDRVVVDLARHLQVWALGLGFDYHDANGGHDAFFRITLWD